MEYITFTILNLLLLDLKIIVHVQYFLNWLFHVQLSFPTFKELPITEFVFITALVL